MLQKLSGRSHTIVSGLALVDAKNGKEQAVKVETKVTFRKLTEQEIDDYIRTGEPLTKAASYQISGGAASFVSKIDGCFYNVVGLPLSS